MIKIEIKTEQVKVKSGVSAKTQKPFKVTEQIGWAFLTSQDGSVKPYPTEIRIQLEEGQFPYKPGFYSIAPQSVVVGQFEKLTFGALILVPVPAAALKSAA